MLMHWIKEKSMKYAKMLGLLAVAATALMAFASPALATFATSPANTTYTGKVKATSTNTVLTNSSTIGTVKCGHSEVEGEITSHSTTSTVTLIGHITKLTFTSCTGGEPTSPVATPGTLEVHTFSGSSDGNGTATSNGAVVTIHKTLVGTCVFKTKATDIGKVVGSKNNGGKTAILEIGSQPIPQESGNPFCPASATWTGTYTVTSPDYLDID